MHIFVLASLLCCTFTNQQDEHSSADTLRSITLITHSWIGVVWGSCSTNSLAARKAGQGARQPWWSFPDRGELKDGRALLLATAWPYRVTMRQAAGKFPPFLGSGVYFIQGALGFFGFRQVRFLVHSLFVCPCPKAVQDVVKPMGVWLLVWTTLSCFTFERILP